MKSNLQVSLRIEGVRKKLAEMGFRCLSGGKFGLPSYSRIEAWAYGATVVYLIYRQDDGGWDILAPVAEGNDAEETWAAVDALLGE